MRYKKVNSKRYKPAYLPAVKVEIPVAHVWVVGDKFGIGREPMQNQKGSGSVQLKAVVQAIRNENFALQVTEYEAIK